MRRYLFVDDNLPLAENLAEIAEASGAACETARDGEDAVARVRARRFDAIVTDMRMPGMGGAALVRAVRRVDPGLPAIVLTAHAGDADLAAARREGLLAVLAKPAPLEQLMRLLEAARRHGVVAVLEEDEAALEAIAEMLRDGGFATIPAPMDRSTPVEMTVRPFVAVAVLPLRGADTEPGLEGLRSLLPQVPLVTVRRAPPTLTPLDAGVLLDALDRIHAGLPEAS